MSAQGVTEAQAKLLLKAATLPYKNIPVTEVKGFAASSLLTLYSFLDQTNKFVYVEDDYVEPGQDSPEIDLVSLILNRSELVESWQATICYGELLFIDKTGNILALVNHTAPVPNTSPFPVMLDKRLSKLYEEPVFQKGDKVYKFYLQGSQLELICGHQLPDVFPLTTVGTVESDNSFCFEGLQTVPAQRLFAIMPFAGRKLEDAIVLGGESRAHEIATALFPQIMLLHLLGLAHNDIKPANILAEHGKSWQLHDFGITTPWSSQAPSNYQSRNGTPLYQYRNINKWQLCSPPLRDCFALCALMYEAIKNENVDPNDKRAYDIFMTREQTCTTFMDFVGVYARDLAQAQKLVDDEVAFFEQRVDSLVCSPLLKEAMKALLPVPKLTRVKGTPARTNIFSAAQTFFGLDYADVMRSVASKYARYVSRVADSVRALPQESTEAIARSFSTNNLSPPYSAMARINWPQTRGSAIDQVNKLFFFLTPLASKEWDTLLPFFAPFPSWNLMDPAAQALPLADQQRRARETCLAQLEGLSPAKIQTLAAEIDPAMARE